MLSNVGQLCVGLRREGSQEATSSPWLIPGEILTLQRPRAAGTEPSPQVKLLCRGTSGDLKREEFGWKPKRHPLHETHKWHQKFSLPHSRKELVSKVWAPPGSGGDGTGLAEVPKG